MTVLRAFAIAAVVASAGSGGSQQVPTRDSAPAAKLTGSAVLSGTVVNSLTNQPVRRVLVTISSSDGGLRLGSVTDEQGRFAFVDLPDGRFFVSASRPGYVAVTLGATRPQGQGTTLAIGPGERRTGVNLSISPGAVIAGTVRSRSGDPVSDVRVMVLRQSVSYLTGEPTLAPAGGALLAFGETTDDRGEFRVFGLPAGEYYVVATAGIGVRGGTELRETSPAEIGWAQRQLQSPGGDAPPAPGRAVDLAPMFYPGVMVRADAARISLKPGEERRGVDVLLDLVPTAKITGQIVNPLGDLPALLQVNVIAHETIPGIPFSGFGSTRADATGRFVTAGLVPGTYTVTVRVGAGRGNAGGAATLFGLATVVLNGADVDATVTLGAGVTVSGRVAFDEHTLKPPADLTRLRISLTPDRSGAPTLGVGAATVAADGSFRFAGVTPGRYRISASALSGWFPQSAVVDGRDAFDQSFEVRDADVSGAEVRFTDVTSEITGDLLDSDGKPAPEYHIIVFPTDRTLWAPQSRRIASVRPASDGRFRFQNLPPGDYRIAAVTDVEQYQWYDPDFLDQLVGASTQLSVGEGERKVQNLRIRGGDLIPPGPMAREMADHERRWR